MYMHHRDFLKGRYKAARQQVDDAVPLWQLSQDSLICRVSGSSGGLVSIHGYNQDWDTIRDRIKETSPRGQLLQVQR